MKNKNYQSKIDNHYHLGSLGNWVIRNKTYIAIGSALIVGGILLKPWNFACPNYFKTSDAGKVIESENKEIYKTQRGLENIDARFSSQYLPEMSIREAEKNVKLEEVLNK